MKTKIALALSLLLLTQCSAPTVNDARSDQLYHIVADRPILCRKGADCDKKWARAVEWVHEHSVTYGADGRKINHSLNKMTSHVIQSGVSGVPETQFRIMKLPQENGTFSIDYSSGCDLEDECYRHSGQLLKMSFVSTLIGLPPGVRQTGPRAFSVDNTLLSSPTH